MLHSFVEPWIRIPLFFISFPNASDHKLCIQIILE